MSDQRSSLPTKNMVSNPSSSSKSQDLRVRPHESLIFYGVMGIICSSIACLLMWVTLDFIRNPNSDPIVSLITTCFSALLASCFCYLAFKAWLNLLRKLNWQNIMFLSPQREALAGNKGLILNGTIAVTYAAIAIYLLWMTVDGSLSDSRLRSILGMTTTSTNAIGDILISKLSMFLIICVGSYFGYHAIVAFSNVFGEIKSKNVSHPQHDFSYRNKWTDDSSKLSTVEEVHARV